MSYIPFISTFSRPIKRQKSHPGCKIAVSSHAPAKSFPPASVRQILQNPVYCVADADAFSYFTERNADLCFSPDSCSGQGLLAYNKRNYRQKGAPRQTEKHWIIAAGRHRGIICGRDWVTTQSLLSNCHRAPENPDAPKGLLCSILYCRHCGSPMVSKRRSKIPISPLTTISAAKSCTTAPLFAAVRISTDHRQMKTFYRLFAALCKSF